MQIRLQAKEFAKEIKMDDFDEGQSWCVRFIKRKYLSIRARTTMSQQLPDYCEEQIENFRKFEEMKQKEYNILDKEIINMKEVPLTFDMPMSHTVDTVGQKIIGIRTTGHEKANFMCVLAVTTEDYKLSPMIIFKRKTVPKEKFPPGIVVKVNAKG